MSVNRTGLHRDARYGRFVLSIVMSSVVGISVARAQIVKPQDEGIQVGRVMFYPSLSLEMTDDSNVFYTSSELPENQVVNSRIFIVRPRLLFDLPFGESFVRWSYSPTYRDYSTEEFQQSDKISHFLDLDASLRIGRSVDLRVKDHFVQGTVELREVDPGGELTFGLTPFRSQDAAMELSVDLGARHGFSIEPKHSEVRFDEVEGTAVFYDFDKDALEARYFIRTSPSTRVYAYYEYEDTDQQREQGLFSEVRETRRSMGVGFRRTVHEAVVTAISAGYAESEFEGGGESNFHGIVFDGSAQWRLREGSAFVASVRRRPFQSFYVNNNYYVSNQLRVQLAKQIGRRLFWQASASASFNRYSDPLDISPTDSAPDLLPEPDGNGLADIFENLEESIGVIREDEILNVEIGVGYLFRRSMRAIVGFNYDRRQSNIKEELSGQLVDPFNTEVNRVFLRLEMGWL